MATDYSLGNIQVVGTAAITSAETALSNLTLSENATAAQLLNFQLELTKNSLVTSMWSSVAKERGDTLKGVLQKF
jgi:hypothetical protein